jgi:TetR/AcrR family transcriptional regulator
MESTPEARRGRGRPPGGRSLQRARLLGAARELLATPGKVDFTLRDVADRAGVTAALAHYYFSNRAGLVAALVRERADPRIDDLLSAARVRAAQPVVALTFLMQRLTSLALTDGFLGQCLLMNSPPALALRDRLRGALRELLQQAQSTGQLRADLTLDYLADALLGMTLFPFIDARGGTTGAAERAAALTLQHVALLQDGIVRGHRPRQESSS